MFLFVMIFKTMQDVMVNHVTLFINQGSGEYPSGNAGINGVTFSGGPLIDVRLIIHELGHVFADRRSKNPYTDVQNALIQDTNGNTVFGTPENSTSFVRTGLGYKSTGVPDMYHGSDYFDDWNAADSYDEDFADMFMNWVLNSFDYSRTSNGAGLARFDWMSQHMGTWLQ